MHYKYKYNCNYTFNCNYNYNYNCKCNYDTNYNFNLDNHVQARKYCVGGSGVQLKHVYYQVKLSFGLCGHYLVDYLFVFGW